MVGAELDYARDECPGGKCSCSPWGPAHHKGGGCLQGGEERESGDAGPHTAPPGVGPLCPHVW